MQTKKEWKRTRGGGAGAGGIEGIPQIMIELVALNGCHVSMRLIYVLHDLLCRHHRTTTQLRLSEGKHVWNNH
jgi:hypothetical protein